MPVPVPPAAAEVSSPAHLPLLQAKDLNGRALSLPHDLPAERTLLLIGYKREQQASVETWTRGLALAGSKMPWLEMPVIDKPNPIVRMLINRGMRSGIADHALWEHVVTAYTDKLKFNQAMGIASEAQVHALVLDRAGNVVERVTGDYTAQGADKLRAALQ